MRDELPKLFVPCRCAFGDLGEEGAECLVAEARAGGVGGRTGLEDFFTVVENM